VIARASKKPRNDVPAPGAAAQLDAFCALAQSPPTKTYPCTMQHGKTYDCLIG
jgi:hypothetical protein